MSQVAGQAHTTPPVDPGSGRYGEPRLPLVLTLLVAAVIPLLMPDPLLPGPRWILTTLILVLLLVMLIMDPGRIDRRSRAMRWLQIGILVILAAGTTFATVALTETLVV